MLQSTPLQISSQIGDNISADIKKMVNERGQTCVSIIVPTHRIGQDRQADLKEVQRSVNEAKQQLQFAGSDLLPDIDSLFQQIDFNRNKEGIGIFVSSRVQKLIRFPFAVTAKINISKSFSLPDMLHVENYSIPYYLLSLSKNEIHLFHGMMDHLNEIVDEHFPMEITDNYEYSKPSRSSSMAGQSHVKGFEKDKSELQQLRLEKIFVSVDKSLKHYVTKGTPIILSGPEKALSLYKSRTRYLDQVIFSKNNYRDTGLRNLEVLAWKDIKSFIDRRKQKLIDDLQEKNGEGQVVSGIKDIWNAVREGKGLQLIVEKEFTKTAFVSADNVLHLIQPPEKFLHYYNIVNEIMNEVLQKRGRVIIVEKDVLKAFGKMVLLTRY